MPGSCILGVFLYGGACACVPALPREIFSLYILDLVCICIGAMLGSTRVKLRTVCLLCEITCMMMLQVGIGVEPVPCTAVV